MAERPPALEGLVEGHTTYLVGPKDFAARLALFQGGMCPDCVIGMRQVDAESWRCDHCGAFWSLDRANPNCTFLHRTFVMPG